MLAKMLPFAYVPQIMSGMSGLGSLGKTRVREVTFHFPWAATCQIYGSANGYNIN